MLMDLKISWEEWDIESDRREVEIDFSLFFRLIKKEGVGIIVLGVISGVVTTRNS